MTLRSVCPARPRLWRALRPTLLAIGPALILPLIVTLAISLVISLAMSRAAAAQDATGLWRTESTAEGYLEVQIAPCGAALCGAILRARDVQGREQPYPHVGRRMIWDMVPTATGAWGRGQIWDPRNDRIFQSRMELSGGGLVVSGCVLGICQSQTWQRVN